MAAHPVCIRVYNKASSCAIAMTANDAFETALVIAGTLQNSE